jgi:hypothetical protein
MYDMSKSTNEAFMTTPSISFEIKSQLAKLLATENLTIRHNPSAQTAYFDTKSRELVLPVWQNISEDLYDMLVVHEVGHALDTPADDWLSAINNIADNHFEKPTDKNKMAVRGFLNVIEDARIDKLQKRRYPGSKRNYVNGYKELYERDFFGIAKKDVNSLTLIDRINIFFKHGACFNIQFTEEERVFLRRIDNAETFKNVISITNDIFGFSIEKRDFKNKTTGEKDITEDMIDELDQQTIYDQDVDLDEDDTDFDDETEMDIEGETNTFDKDIIDEELDIPETEKNAEDFMNNIVAKENVSYIYLNTPEFNHTNIVNDYKVVIADIYPQYLSKSKFDTEYSSRMNDFTSFKKKEMDTISFMVKEFEMKKSADAYARTSVAKTGILDTNKIHSYVYNEDIFRKVSLVPNGKNHGFFIILDWSGSMISDLKDTINQLISIVLFCKRIQVPFEVYTFINSDRICGDCLKDKENSDIRFDNFNMRNILSSRMNTKTLNDALCCLWFTRYGYQYTNDIMNSTPLNQAILASDVLINEFRQKNKLQVVNTIVLTDGGSDPMKVSSNAYEQQYLNKNQKYQKYRFFIRDHVTKKMYDSGTNTSGHKVTEIFLKMLKERTGCNLVGFFLTRSMKNLYNLLNIDYTMHDNLTKKFKEDLFVKLHNVGYDEYYCVNVRQMSLNQNDTLNVNSDMSQKGIVKQFIKFSEKKSVNRALLTTFINRVTKAA